MPDMLPLLLAATVAISDFAFKPVTLTVPVGETVRFVNRDQEAHTVSAADGSFDSGGLDTGGSWVHRFTKPGRYTFFCELHPYMKGAIVVVPARRKP
jgi:plastocyanin